MKTLVASPFEDDALELVEWAYGKDARHRFVKRYFFGDQRIGQAFMNTLFEVDPESYQRLTGSLWDPFYDDARLGQALDKLTSK